MGGCIGGLLLAAVFASVVTGIMEGYQGAVDPHRGIYDVVITWRHIVCKVDNITGARTRRNGAVGVGKI